MTEPVKCVMRLIGLANGDASAIDGEYLVEYEPAAMRADGRGYEGGALVTTTDIARAQRFADVATLFECFRKVNGIRSYDGKPNRPLTAYTVEVVRVEP